ncbi:translation initiation factor IF-2 [Candidatus Roizmanbacteria bacterium RIFCSPLOWO2_01_FULL_37_12]|uniref:Translation initiation factor IF-2 n=1 Tax=Candidatus Roizmanbacteria bacterium RIFCSPLOWO2_01_FULL_37_12 TaxID=1802056 RepID=A0A1F7I8V2_9BACT|nr:MAG: translation initiation factor IF-2 [Candidatus Roizmanbacteria bacterium RIFCSPHIGHO2_01_FULL_37_16]OGK23732.1 MAG: translation initiation factor IF-2 [Candidatus Roizmanbacteria bacterium RIFCSPHIGHO2_02_FULL_37_9b]OGK39774.1 MAG: translation initiation factor IF-2 [Candidatus Roizmanbacteria bacterium RIFCSPLOWO2_01_FULL_37_12]
MSTTISRPPIVAVLGHVDHGKTTLLDFIRKTSLTAKEYGGITQKIGAYEITTNFKDYNTNKITFIDTPGHEAFSLLRARGANVSDIAILIIDAKDSVMPQTVESISHIKSAKTPLIVVINKIDLPEANPEKVKNDLLKYEIIVEGKGGGIPVVLVSAKTGKGVRELLEAILLVATDLNLQYSVESSPRAYIIEAKKDKRGTTVSAIIKDGRLKIGDFIRAEDKKAKIRAMFNDHGTAISEVTPSMPFEFLGFSDLPEVGSVITPESEFAKQAKKSNKNDDQKNIIPQKIDLDALLNPKKKDKKLSLIIRADSQGSLDAISQSLESDINIEVVLKAVGDINKSDIFLAKSTGSIIIGFSTTVSDEANQLAKQEKVIIKTYNIIYDLLDELGEVADLIKEKQQKEKNLKGSAKILASFIIKGEKIYGVKIIKGKINLGDELEIHRAEQLLGKTKLVSLKVRAKSLSEVKKEQEAGMIFSHPLDIHIGDVVKSIL